MEFTHRIVHSAFVHDRGKNIGMQLVIIYYANGSHTRSYSNRLNE